MSESGPPEVSVVVPLFNESENVTPLLEEIARALSGRDYELILVDDGSTDSTSSRVPREDPIIRLISFSKNRGQSAALHAGISAARFPLLVLLDGDLQNDPADIPRLLQEIDAGADLVCGYRAERMDAFSRKLQSRVANAIRRAFTRDGVRDTGCTLKAMRSACREALPLFNGMHRFIPAFVRAAGYEVREIPVSHRARRHGSSKYTLSNRAWRGLVDLFGVCWLIARRKGVLEGPATAPHPTLDGQVRSQHAPGESR
ncbi:MAG TPA: glycosyltransferase family 2 protein [Verrucomicrobiales bacterium]|nr:glycosyltransferase family 2 protein [Verrucomicrobiales bacterium]